MSKRCMGCMELYDDEFDICPLCGYVEGSGAEEPTHMEPGTLLADRYIVGRVLGYGGFGVTYVCWDGKLEQKVAIKEFLPTEFSTRIVGQTRITVLGGRKAEQFNDGMKKFVEEAKRLAKFQSETGIVKVFDSFEENETAYIVMEYLDGETLAEYLKREGVMNENDAVDMLMPIMLSLKNVHEKNLIHRDIAPDNIFITKDGEVKLIDFGAARFATTSHSRSLTVLIKPGFSPEEQYRSSSDQGPYTDVYALGATLYKMITGKTPPDAMKRRVEYEQKNKNLLQDPTDIKKEISLNRENAILNAMNIRVEDRTPDMETFIAELTSETPAKRRVGRIKKLDFYKWPLWLKILVPVLFVILGTLGIMVATGVIDVPSLFSGKVEIQDGWVEVPDVRELDSEEAIALLEKSNLVASADENVKSDYCEVGKILFQSVEPGRWQPVNSVVSLTVSSGTGVTGPVNGVITVPLVEWADKETALADLKTAGFDEASIKIEERQDETVSAGKVISQSIEAGGEVPVGSELTIVVSTGKPTIKIPNVRGMSYANAKRTLENAGFAVIADSTSGTVSNQTPAAGTQATRGTSVKLTLKRASKTTTKKSTQVAATTGTTKATTTQKPTTTKPTTTKPTTTKPTTTNPTTTKPTTTQKKRYLVEFNANGGSVNETARWVDENSAIGSLPTPIRTYYTFNGWYDAPVGGMQYTSSSRINGITTLYASWSANSWSGWVTSLPSNVTSSNYAIETRTEYRSRTISSSWGSWSSWTTTKHTSSSTEEVQTKTQYSYSRWLSANAKWSGPTKGTWNGYYCGTQDVRPWSDTALPKDAGYTQANGFAVFKDVNDKTFRYWYNQTTRTMYRYRIKSTSYGSWSSWSTTPKTASSTLGVETRTTYRYRAK